MAYFFIIAAALIRVLSHFNYLPHIPNFAPIAAIAIFSGVYLKDKRIALIVPIVAMIISDAIIGFYNPWIMASVYGSFLAIGLIGLWLKNNKTVTNILGASLTGSVLFFLITNFAMWAVQPYMKQAIYPHTLQGLMQSYTMGLPFFRNTLMGDLFYVSTMFGLMETVSWIVRKYPYKKIA